LKGNVSYEKRKEVEDFRMKLFQDTTYRPGGVDYPKTRGGKQQEFELKVDVKQRPPAAYTREIVVPPDADRADKPARGNWGGDWSGKKVGGKKVQAAEEGKE